MSVRVWERSVVRISETSVSVKLRHKVTHVEYSILLDKSDWILTKDWDFNVQVRKHDGRLSVRLNKIGSNDEKVYLSRLLLNCPDNMVVDHINHNTLDNRRCNLRILNNHRNSHNRKGCNRNGKSGIRGVTWDERNKKWKAYVHNKGVFHYLGLFVTIHEAENKVVNFRKSLVA